MTRIARYAVAAAALAALAAPVAAQTIPEECTGTTHRCVELMRDAVCVRTGVCA